MFINISPIYPNLIVVDSPIKNYSPVDLVQEYMDSLDNTIGTYIVFNSNLKIGHRVMIKESGIEIIDFIT